MTERQHRTTRVIGHLVTRNEMDRYLAPCIAWVQAITDGPVAVYDDQSTDGTPQYLRDVHVEVQVRPDTAPSFRHNEAEFRANAWRHMERATNPTTDDWILCLDADEFLLPTDPSRNTRHELTEMIETAQEDRSDAIAFNVDEVFEISPTGLQVRTDGWWGEIRACRLVRWRPGAKFGSRPEGGGSVPSDWIDWSFVSPQLHLVHLGYASEADRLTRFHRYSAGRGHNPAHIRSILGTPSLRPWSGPDLPVWPR